MKKKHNRRLKLYDSAVGDFENNDIITAKNKFKRLTMLTPWNQYAYFYLGRCLLKTEEYEEAVEEFGKTISLSPELLEAYIGLSLAHNMLGEFNKSLIVLKKALEISPYDSSLYYHLGITYEYGIEKGRGYKYFKKALSLNPDNAYAHFELGNYYYRAKKNVKAIEHLRKSSSIDPQFIHPLLRLLEIYEIKRWKNKSIEIYDKLINAEPNRIEHYAGKTALLLKMGNFKEASRTLKKAFELAPNNTTLKAMNKYIKKHRQYKAKSVEEELKEIEGILIKQKEKNKRRIESLNAEVERLKKEKRRLKKEVSSLSSKSEDLVKRLKGIKHRYKKQMKEILLLKNKEEKEKRLEEANLKVIECAHQVVKEQVKAEKEDLKKVELKLKNKIGIKEWNTLTKDSRHFFVTAEFLYSLGKQKEIDFGLISVELSKAIEVELNDKLINQFCRYLKTNGKEEQFMKENLKKTCNGKPKYYTNLAYLVDNKNYPDIKNLSLGQIKNLLEDAIKGYIGTSTFRVFIESHLSIPEYFLSKRRFPKVLEIISTKYRNPFAHSKSLDINAFELFHSELFQGFCGGIIVQFLNASKPC
jgi:tetratricopeptide (TPR) repeat protein